MSRDVAAILLVLASGCAAVRHDSSTLAAQSRPVEECAAYENDIPPEVRQRAEAEFPSGGVAVFEISPENPNKDFDLLMGLFRVSEKTNVRLVFWGRDSSVTRQVLVRALEQAGAPHTPKLKLMYFGAAADADIVRDIVQTRGGTFVAAR